MLWILALLAYFLHQKITPIQQKLFIKFRPSLKLHSRSLLHDMDGNSRTDLDGLFWFYTVSEKQILKPDSLDILFL